MFFTFSVILDVNVPSIQTTIGSDVTFKCFVNEDEVDVTYAWYLNDSLIHGQTDKELTLTNVRKNDDGNEYTCVVRSNGVNGSGSGILTILSKKNICIFFNLLLIACILMSWLNRFLHYGIWQVILR